MKQTFDKDYWESHWQEADEHASGQEVAPNPYLAREVSGLARGTALDAGCGEGAEAIWLATEGWQVTAADISAEVLARDSQRATTSCAAPDHVQWVEADLSVWEPGQQFDLVTTHYAHPAMPQQAFYQRISRWVAPGGTLLIVGHLHTSETTAYGHGQEPQGHGHSPPEQVSVTAASITAGFDATRWDIITADEPIRTLTDRAGRSIQLDDVVVRATRRP
jgi:SAM-dependent methyltransferase